MIQTLIRGGVNIPCPESVVLEDIDPEKIQSGVTLYPGTVLRGRSTSIGKNSSIGLGGGAFLEDVQTGERCTLMQGCYRNCTFLDDVIIRNGAEIREGCLLEEHAELGHTCGLKQTIFFPNVVAGSLINFCDALITGGTSRKNHSEIGSCMALYNFTPQGDKFASLFGDVEHGVFLNQDPIFIGGQTQIVSPVKVGFGSVIAAGSKLTHSIEDHILVSQNHPNVKNPFDSKEIHRPYEKIQITLDYIKNLKMLSIWYQKIRIPLYCETDKYDLIRHAHRRILSGIEERERRLEKFIQKLPASLEILRQKLNQSEAFIQEHNHDRSKLALFETQRQKSITSEIESHEKSLSTQIHQNVEWEFEDAKILSHLKSCLARGKSYTEAMSEL